MSTSEVSDSPSGGRCDTPSVRTPPVRTVFTEAEAIQIRGAMNKVFGHERGGPYNNTSAVEIRLERREMFAALDEALRLFDNVGRSFDVVEVAPENVVTWEGEQREQQQQDEYFGCPNNEKGHELRHLGWECTHCDTYWEDDQ